MSKNLLIFVNKNIDSVIYTSTDEEKLNKKQTFIVCTEENNTKKFFKVWYDHIWDMEPISPLNFFFFCFMPPDADQPGKGQYEFVWPLGWTPVPDPIYSPIARIFGALEILKDYED